jgi:hypothetical protein
LPVPGFAGTTELKKAPVEELFESRAIPASGWIKQLLFKSKQDAVVRVKNVVLRMPCRNLILYQGS